MADVLKGLEDFVGKLIHLPGNVLNDVAGIFPSDKGHEDFNTYCTSKGGTITTGPDGKPTCQMAMNISSDLHGQMLQALPAQQRFEDMTPEEQHDLLKKTFLKKDIDVPMTYGDDMLKRMKGGS